MTQPSAAAAPATPANSDPAERGAGHAGHTRRCPASSWPVQLRQPGRWPLPADRAQTYAEVIELIHGTHIRDSGAFLPGAPWRADGELVAVRHGQSLANVAFADAQASGAEVTAVGCRDADVVLSPVGCAQAAALGRWLRGRPPPGSVYCSPYLRARETWRIAASEIAATHQGMPVVVDERLRDREMGRLELLTPAAIGRRFPQEARRRADAGEFRYRPPGGESLADVALRLRGFLREVDPARRPLIVAHDAVVLMLRYLIESLPEEDLPRVPPAANASVTRWAVVRGFPRLAVYNDVSHLDLACAGRDAAGAAAARPGRAQRVR